MKIDTNIENINLFLNRGLENIFPNKELALKMLSSGKRLKIYLGIDPTGPTLHLGHAAVLMKLSQLQKMGHEIILLIGDFTAMIGDQDKLSVRKPLSRKDVLSNCKNYKKQASIFLNFWGMNKAKIKYNSKWLSKMDFSDVLSLASKMTVDQMIKREMFQERIKQNRPIYIHEFMYPLMQGQDSIALDVDAEIGGNDQIFNMLTGRDLVKEILGREKLVFGVKLFADPSGKKMGKTEGNMVTLNDTEYEMFGKVMSWTDAMILPAFEILTYVSDSEIEKMRGELTSGVNPKDIKMRLAFEITKIYHGENKAEKARMSFDDTFKNGGLPENIEEVKAEKDIMLVDVLLKSGIVSSKGDFRRLLDGGAISDVNTGEKINDSAFKLSKDITLRVGKKRFIKIKI